MVATQKILQGIKTGFFACLLVNVSCQQTASRIEGRTQRGTKFGDVATMMGEAEARQRATDVIVSNLQSRDPYLRANAIESAHWLPDRALSMIQIGLTDENEAVRFAAATMVGRLKLVELVDAVKSMSEDPSTSVRTAVLFALKRCDESIDISLLGSMLFHDDAAVRGNVALLLSLLEDPSAIDMLKSSAGKPLPRWVLPEQKAVMRIQIAEAMVVLGDESALEIVRANAFSQFDEVRVIAVQAMGRLSDREFERALVNMLNQPPIELSLAAAESLSRMGNFRGLDYVLKGCQFHIEAVRAQAGLVLAKFPNSRAAQMRVRLLADPSPQVQLAAAAAIMESIATHPVVASGASDRVAD